MTLLFSEVIYIYIYICMFIYIYKYHRYIHKDFAVVPIDKATGNIALVCKRFYASVITRELGLNNLQILTRMPVAYLQML